MQIVLFERSYKYQTLLKKKKFIEAIRTCSKTLKAHFGPLGLLGVKVAIKVYIYLRM